MTSWTERYLEVALQAIRDDKRSDVERELRSSITDAIDERVAAGEDAAAAERAVLEALGDPAELAAGYTGRPNYLIGPELFPLYRATVPRIVAASVPIAALVLGALTSLGGGNLADVIGGVISGTINVIFQIAFWGTLAFVVLERADAARAVRDDVVSRIAPWSVERLPKPSPRRVSARQAVGGISGALVAAGGLLFLQSLNMPGPNGAWGLFDGPFGSQWFWFVEIVLVARAALHIVTFAAGRWTMPLATANAILVLCFALPIAAFALSGQLIDFYFADAIGWHGLPDGTGLPMLAVAGGTTLVAALEIALGFARLRPDARLGSILQVSRHSA